MFTEFDLTTQGVLAKHSKHLNCCFLNKKYQLLKLEKWFADFFASKGLRCKYLRGCIASKRLFKSWQNIIGKQTTIVATTLKPCLPFSCYKQYPPSVS